MIVVTGSCRTGTSWAMNVLREIGMPVAGQAFHAEFSHKELNPNGYWELPESETVGGIHHGNYEGMAE